MKLTHFNEKGNAYMVDVSEKEITDRIAVAKGSIMVSKAVYEAVSENRVKKGDVFSVATTAGIMGAKKTFELIPMCHLISLSHCSVDWEIIKPELEGEEYEIKCICTVKSTGKTGVEMEALTGVSTSLLTFYDMVKSMDKSMRITDIYLSRKEGGKSGVVSNE